MAAVEDPKQREATWPHGRLRGSEVGAAGPQLEPKVPAGISVVGATPQDPLPEILPHPPFGIEPPVSSHMLQFDAQAGQIGNGPAGAGVSNRFYAGQAQPSQGNATAAAASAQPAGTLAAVSSRIDEALKKPDYLKALGEAYAKAPPDEQGLMRADTTFQLVISDAAKRATKALTDTGAAPLGPAAQARSDMAIKDLLQMLEHLDPAFAALVADQAVPVFQQFYRVHQNMPNGSGFGPQGITTLTWLSGRIAGTPQGDHAMAGFVALNAWDAAAVRDAMAHGAGNAYAIAYARFAEVQAKDSSFVLRSLEQVSLRETRAELQRMAASDAREFAIRDAEMAWIAQNVCGPFGSELVPTVDGHLALVTKMGTDGYLGSRSPKEKHEDEMLRNRVVDDGVKLLKHMIALGKLARGAGLAPAMQEQLVALAQDQPSCIAIQMAIETHPELLQGDGLKEVVELVEALRNRQHPAWGDKSASRLLLTAGDVGKLGFLAIRITDVAAKAFVSSIPEFLRADDLVDLTEVKATHAITKWLEGLRNDYFARLVLFDKADLDSAINSTERFTALASRARKIFEWQQEQMVIGMTRDSVIAEIEPRLANFVEGFFAAHPETSSPNAMGAALREIARLSQDENAAAPYKVSKAQFDDALYFLKGAYEDMEKVARKNPIAAPTAEDFAAMDNLQAEARRLNAELGKLEASGRSKVPGRTMRLFGVGMAVLGAASSLKAFIGNKDWVEGLKTADLGLLAGQQVGELLVSLGVAGPTSAIGRYAGASLRGVRLGALGSRLGIDGSVRIGRGPLGGVLLRAYAVFEAVDALRSGFGIWGGTQDTGAAVLSGTSAVGFAMTAAPAFEATSWSGPVGWTIAIVAAIGRSIYDGVKDAHKYEAASETCLKAMGFNDLAAAKLSRQAAYLSAVPGTAQMPFLARYAHYRGMTMVALRDWINTLKPEQIEALSDEVLHALNEGVSDPARHRQEWVGVGLQDKSPVPKVSSEEVLKRWETIEMSVFERGLVRDKVLDADKVTSPSFEPAYR